MAAHLPDPQQRAPRPRVARYATRAPVASGLRAALESGATRGAGDRYDSIATASLAARSSDVARRNRAPGRSGERARRTGRAGSSNPGLAPGVSNPDTVALTVTAPGGRAPLGRHRARLVPLLRRATVDPGRPACRPPRPERQTARRGARRDGAGGPTP